MLMNLWRYIIAISFPTCVHKTIILMNKNHKEKSKYIFELKIFFLNQGSYEDWKSMEFDLSIFQVYEKYWKVFIVPFFIMKNAGYKHFGFSTILHCLKDLCTKKNLTNRTMHSEPPVVPSAHFAVWFLGCHRLCIKETKGLEICPTAPMKANSWTLFYRTSLFYRPLKLANVMPSAHFVS